MSAGRYNLQIGQGKLYDKTFTWKINDALVNLTGYSAKLRLYTSSQPNILTLTTTLDGLGNGIILGGSAGTVRIVIKTAKTTTFSFSKASYELELTQPDGEDVPFLIGGAYVTKEYIDP